MKNFMAIILLVSVFGCANYIEHNYTRKNCKVIEVENEIVTVVDNGGMTWDFKGDGFRVGDIVDLKMHDSNTIRVGDDVIKDVVR